MSLLTCIQHQLLYSPTDSPLDDDGRKQVKETSMIINNEVKKGMTLPKEGGRMVSPHLRCIETDDQIFGPYERGEYEMGKMIMNSVCLLASQYISSNTTRAPFQSSPLSASTHHFTPALQRPRVNNELTVCHSYVVKKPTRTLRIKLTIPHQKEQSMTTRCNGQREENDPRMTTTLCVSVVGIQLGALWIRPIKWNLNR